MFMHHHDGHDHHAFMQRKMARRFARMAMAFGMGPEDFEEHRCGPRGFGGRRHGHHGPFGFGHGFGFGGPDDFGFRSGRKLSSSELQLVLLALLAQKPRHGYELIKAIEERSNGFYSPSPGVIYPALTYLEEAGQAISEAEGARKRYRLTPDGERELSARRADADALLARLEKLGRKMDRVREALADDVEDDRRGSPERDELFEAVQALRALIAACRGAAAPELKRIATVLREAAEKIRRG